MLKLFFAGDFCSKPSTKEITVSDELRSVISSCDFKIVNFEVPLKPEEIKMPKIKRERFFQHDDAPDFLRGLGFNLFQVANNHAFDWGEQGFNKMVAALGDCTFGAGTYDDAYKVKVVEKDGLKIGFMALSFAAYTGVFDGGSKEGLGCAYINGKPIFYSLGNFLFNSKDGYDYRATNRPHWYEGLCVIISIKDGALEWEVINTRNVDNVGIEIDKSPERVKHNETICGYISDKEVYGRCLADICGTLGVKERAIIDETIHTDRLKDCTRLILRLWKNKLLGRKGISDYPLQRLLAHDARRDLLRWTLSIKD